jgi:hypothetical protein
MISSVPRPKIFRAGSITSGGWLKTPLSLSVEASEETIDAGGYSITARAVNAKRASTACLPAGSRAARIDAPRFSCYQC